MARRDDQETVKRARRLSALAEAEGNVLERLFAVRGEVFSVLRSLDRLGLAHPPRMLAGPTVCAGKQPPLRPGRENLVPFPRKDE